MNGKASTLIKLKKNAEKYVDNEKYISKKKAF